MIREVRSVAIDQAEIRKADDSSDLGFLGHASVFNQRTWIGPKDWGFWEEVDAGFFADVLNDDAAFLVNHDPNIVLARAPKTLKLSVDTRGLVADAEWDTADPDAQKWAGRVRRGDVSKMSFAFTVAPEGEAWLVDDNGDDVRRLLRADRLYDVSLVTYPAYEGTDGGLRDATAAVVKRHKGYDPRTDSKPARTDEKVAAAAESDAEVRADEPAADEPVASAGPSEALKLRHRLNGKRMGLPL